MALPTIYGYERFDNPTTKLVQLKSAVTGLDTGDSALDEKYVGCIIDVTNSSGAATVKANKTGFTFAAGHSYYLLAEIPVPADNADHHFVGVILRDQAAIDNLIPRRPLQNWAKQFYDLKTGGVK